MVGTNTGTVTDFDGNYRLSVPDDATQLQFSYTGYTTQTIDLGASNTISLQMSAGTILDEVVVIGYGTVKREDATGSIVAVGTEQFNRGSITSAQELLAGKVAGVAISTVGEPGGASVIRNWGRIGTSGQSKMETFDSDGEAATASTRLERAKRRRGYRDSGLA